MKILVLMKRFGVNKDMPLFNFGRQIRLFENLAKKHCIDFLCPDYKKFEFKNIKRDNIRYYIRPFSKKDFFSFMRNTKNLMKQKRYDVIIGSTDPVLSIIAFYLSKKLNIPFIYEMQDPYNVYDSYKIPGVPFLDKRAIKGAKAVICISNALKKEIEKINSSCFLVENGVEINLFKPMKKEFCRKKLGLNKKDKIICYTGLISPLKGLDILFASFRLLKNYHPNLKLLLSGKIDESMKEEIANDKDIIFEELPRRIEVVYALNASDVLVIPNPINEFTKYCFPYKLPEYMATNTPIVATSVGDVNDILKNFDDSLCKPDDVTDLTEKIKIQMKKRRIGYRRIAKKYEWSILSQKIDKILDSLKS